MYRWLKRTSFYRTFLSHRVWAWETAIGCPIISMIPIGGVAGLWFVAIPGTFIITSALLSSYLLGPDSIAITIYFSGLLALISLAPIMLDVVSSIFWDWLACAGLMLGSMSLAHQRLDTARQDLLDWKLNHA